MPTEMPIRQEWSSLDDMAKDLGERPSAHWECLSILHLGGCGRVSTKDLSGAAPNCPMCGRLMFKAILYSDNKLTLYPGERLCKGEEGGEVCKKCGKLWTHISNPGAICLACTWRRESL